MDREYALSLINNKILLHSILTFNLESKADKDKLPAKVASFFENYPQFMQGLNKNSFLLKPANFAAAEFLDFKDLKTRILLLDDADFEQILLYLGACVYAPYITKIVIKKDLACIQTALGKNVYDFVMQHGRYVVGTISLQEYALLEPEYIVDVTIKAGSIQKKVNATAARRYELADQRRQSIVGVNQYVNLAEKKLKFRKAPAVPPTRATAAARMRIFRSRSWK